jgi:AcrR family transcriptional regulator
MRSAEQTDRLSSDERRDALLDAALVLLRDGGPDGVTIGTVAERAQVTRALVYKHFANRSDLLSAVFRREAAQLDRAMTAEVAAAHGFEARLRTFVRVVFRADDTHGWIFAPLQTHSLERGFRKEQRARDRRTLRAFAELASVQFNLPLPDASAALAVLLSGISALRRQARARSTPAEREYLEDLYFELVCGALRTLAAERARS